MAFRSRIRLMKLCYFIFVEWINPLQLHLFKLYLVVLFPFYGNFVMVQRKVTVPSQSCSIRVTNTCLVEQSKRTFFRPLATNNWSFFVATMHPVVENLLWNTSKKMVHSYNKYYKCFIILCSITSKSYN